MWAPRCPTPTQRHHKAAYDDITDEQIQAYLSTLGGFDGPLDRSEIAAIMPAVRHDASGASRFFLEAHRVPPVPLRAPLHCVFGDRDKATEGYRTRYRDWEPFGRVAGVHTIEGGGHYFVRDHARQVAALLAQQAGDRAGSLASQER